MNKNNDTNKVLLFVICLGFSVRILGIFYPLPFSGDAYTYLQMSMKFGTGDLNPHYFIHPAFTFYITFIAESILFAGGYIFGFFSSVSDFISLFFEKDPLFLIAGRVPSLLASLATVYFVYLIGKENWGRKTGLFAAFMLAVTPLHVHEAHTTRIRGIATFFGVLCLFFVFRVLKNNSKKNHIFTGLSLGCAVACEYTMVFFVIPLIIVFIFNFPNRDFNKNFKTFIKSGLLSSVIFGIGSFILCSPFTLFDYPANINEIKSALSFGNDLVKGWDSGLANLDTNKDQTQNMDSGLANSAPRNDLVEGSDSGLVNSVIGNDLVQNWDPDLSHLTPGNDQDQHEESNAVNPLTANNQDQSEDSGLTGLTLEHNSGGLVSSRSSRLSAWWSNICKYIFTLFDSKMFTMGKVFASLSFCGVLFALLKREKKLLILLSLVLGFLVIQPVVVPPLPRVIIMAYPVLLLLAAIFIVSLIDKFSFIEKLNKRLPFLIMLVIGIPNIVELISYNLQLTKNDTRVMAKEWIEENIAAGSHLLIEDVRLSGYITINESRESLNRKYIAYKSIIDNIPEYKGNALLRKEIEMENIKEPSYFIDYFYQPCHGLNLVVGEFATQVLQARFLSFKKYREDGVDYIITARFKSNDNSSEDQNNFFNSLESNCNLVKVFKYDNSLDAWRNPLINPEIRIYSLPKS